ncbi:MAG: EAL and HDOD domain-containing protein [Myxococcota bacterium]
MTDHDGFFLSRQPVVASERTVMGWQLEMQSAAGDRFQSEQPVGDGYLSALEAFASSADWDSMLCGGRAFLYADRRIVYSDIMELIPRNRLVLQLTAQTEVNASLSNRLHALSAQRGVRLAFLDYGRRDPREMLIDLADAVHVDAFGQSAEARGLLIRRAKRRGLQVMANSIRSDSDFMQIRAAGFDLIHGVSYQDASADELTRANPDGKLIMQLLVEAGADIEIPAVTEVIEGNETLTEGLLRLVNSLELARAQKIESVGQSLMMIGAKGLSRWLMLLLFQIGHQGGAKGPLFRVAASRAKQMELLTLDSAGTSPSGKERGHEAFLIGILSLVHVLFGMDRQAVLADLALTPEMDRALGEYGGELGRMLRLVECLDRGDFAETAELAEELDISSADLWRHQKEAYAWVMQME